MGMTALQVAEMLKAEEEQNKVNMQRKVRAAYNTTFENPENTTFVAFDSLVPFENQPYKQLSDDKLQQLADSIKENGLLNPLLIRVHPLEPEKNQILSGNNRYYAMRDILHYKPDESVFVKFITCDNEDDAIRVLIDSNESQRENISPSERAAAVRLRYDTIKNTYGEEKNGRRSKDIVAEEFGISATQVKRFLDVNKLTTDWKDTLDDGNISFEGASIIGGWKEIDQKVMFEYAGGKKIKAADVEKIDKLVKESNKLPLTVSIIEGVLKKTTKEVRTKVPPRYKTRIPEHLAPTMEECDKLIIEAIDRYISELLAKENPEKSEKTDF